MKNILLVIIFISNLSLAQTTVKDSIHGFVKRVNNEEVSEEKKSYSPTNLIKIHKDSLLTREKRVIYVNNKKNVSLFFPKPIRQGIVGASHYAFSYNKETPNFLGIIKGNYGLPSNLLVITTDGQVYSFIVRYSKKLIQLNYFVSPEETIGNENQGKREKKREINVSKTFKKAKDYRGDYETVYYNNKLPDTAHYLYNTNRYEYYKKFALNQSVTAKKNVNIRKKVDDVELVLKDIVYNYNELYFVMEIRNGSGVDYDVNFLNISTTNANKRRRKSSQTLLKKPIYVYQLYSRVKRKTIDRVVYVVPKFSINKQKKVIIELNELNGERNITIEVDKDVINNPS